MVKDKKFYETTEFQKLNSAWSKKLKCSGFDDIETKKDIQTDHVNKQEFNVDHGLVLHNQKCSAHLNSGKMKDILDLFIFEKYCEGMSLRQIEGELIKFKFKRISKDTIHRRILRILQIADIEPLRSLKCE